MYDMKEQNLGKKCRYSSKCPVYQGIEEPRNMDLTIWRNVFCYRGMKGWSNCHRFHAYEQGYKEERQEARQRQH